MTSEVKTNYIYKDNIPLSMRGSYQLYYTPSRSIWEVKLA